jgi:hypothetical protein
MNLWVPVGECRRIHRDHYSAGTNAQRVRPRSWFFSRTP